MKIWELLGGLVSLIALILWVRSLLRPSLSATWPRQDFLRITFLYIIPFFLVLLSAVGINAFAEDLEVPEGVITFTIGIPVLFMFPVMLLAFLYPMGVPTPPFLVPRWIREQDREHRRLKRTARQRRWQDPKVKKAEVWFNISVPFIVIAIVVVTFFIIVGIASLFV